MIKEKFTVAKALIEQKQYSEARGVLKTIDHPTAERWLAKLDEIAPEVVERDSNPLRKVSKKYWAIAGVVALVIVGLLVANRLLSSSGPSRQDVYNITYSRCSLVETSTKDGCVQVATTYSNEDYFFHRVSYCIKEYGSFSWNFEDCMDSIDFTHSYLIFRAISENN